MPAKTIKRINYGLVGLIVLCNGFLLFGFFKPVVEPFVKKTFDPVKHIDAGNPLPKENTLLIPSIQLETPIKTGLGPGSLNNAAWLRPAGSTPDEGGNTVLAGHRFAYLVKPTFYNLNRVRTGDVVQIVWEGRVYDYRVSEIKETEPNAVEIEDQNFGERLTIYTCTPLWSSARRLVVIAEPN